jgi:uncharacterized protein
MKICIRDQLLYKYKGVIIPRIEMDSRCETIGKYVVPVFRSLVAKELVNTHHLTQAEAAQKLGTTQAAISQYINSKRAAKSVEQFGDILPRIQAMAVISAGVLAKTETGREEVTLDLCRLCSSLFNSETSKIGDNYSI